MSNAQHGEIGPDDAIALSDDQLAAASGGSGDWVDRNFNSQPGGDADVATSTVPPVAQRVKAPKWID